MTDEVEFYCSECEYVWVDLRVVSPTLCPHCGSSDVLDPVTNEEKSNVFQ